MTYKELLSAVTEKLRASRIEDAQFEARQLLQEAIGVNATQLIVMGEKGLSKELVAKVQLWAERRATGYPLAYLSGRRGFYKSIFKVEDGVLIPRPETELLVELTIKKVKSPPSLIGDFGCGTGCIGLSLLREWPQANLVAIDKSAKACALTLKNAADLRLQSRVHIENKNVTAFSRAADFDVIVANPPYISRDDQDVQASVRAFEPDEALFSADNGLADIKSWSQKAHSLLSPDGIFVMEFGASQGAAVKELLLNTGFRQIEIHQDLAGKDRAITAQK